MASALIFPGQGSHEPGMDAQWRGTATFERGLELLGFDPFDALDEGTRTQQPALFLCSVCAWEADDTDDAIAAAGHSLGEYAALVATGVLDFPDAVALVKERADAMAYAASLRPGGMVAMLGGDSHEVSELARRHHLTVANDNAPGQLVLSGAMTGIDAAAAEARDATGARAMKLDVAGAFHSPLMEPAAERLAAALAATPIHEGTLPVYCNSTVAPFVDVRRELADNLLKPVRWRETLLALSGAGAQRFVELGPGSVLTGLVKRTLALAA